MNKLEFELNNKPHTVSFGNILVLANNSNTHELVDAMIHIFEGATKSAFFNHQEIVKKQFIVSVINTDTTIEDEFKLSSKSIYTQYIKNKISDLNDETIDELLNNFNAILSEINSLISLSSLYDNKEMIKSEMFAEDLFSIVKEFLEFKNLPDIDYTDKNKILLSSILYIRKNHSKVLIIENFDSYDLSEKMEVLDLIKKDENSITIIITKDIDFIESVYKELPIYVPICNFQELNNLYETIVSDVYIDLCVKMKLPYFDDKEIKLITFTFEKCYLHYFILYVLSKNREKVKEIFFKNDNLIEGLFQIFNKFEEIY